MEWALGAAAALIIYLYGRSHSWWGSAQSAPIVCDLEADMPDDLKQAVLAQVASQTNPVTLQSFAAGLAQQNYIQGAYCLMQRAWVISGSKGPAPTPPTAAQISAAQAARAAAAAANLGQMTLGQLQVAPGMPNINAPVGSMIAVVGATPYDPASNPGGFTVSAQPSTATALNPTVYAIVGPGTITFNWSNTSQTVITAIAASTAPAAAAASSMPAATTPSSTAAAAASAASVPGLDPTSVQAAVDSLGNLVNSPANAATASALPAQSIPASTPSMPSQTSGFAHRNAMV